MPRVAKAPTPATSPPPPAAQVAAFLARFDPAVAALARATRRAVRARFPTATELVYDNYNALALGFSSTERTSDAIVSVAVYARGVNLYFMYGKSLPDPDGVLQGSGNQGRFIRVENAATLRAPHVQTMLTAAAAHAKTPLPRTGRGRTIIRSISARQRPRRPATNHTRR